MTSRNSLKIAILRNWIVHSQVKELLFHPNPVEDINIRIENCYYTVPF